MLKVLLALLPLISIMFMIFVLKKSSIFTGIVACMLTAAIALSPIFNSNIMNLTEPIIKAFLLRQLLLIFYFSVFFYFI